MIINNLSVAVDNKLILKNISLACPPGSVQLIIGPNGSGKSTLATALMGHPAYQITEGSVTLACQDLLALPIEKRSRAGLFLAFQHPYTIPGVKIFTFLKEAHRLLTGQEMSVGEFQQLVESIFAQVHLDPAYLQRCFNDGFSGGEKKRLELAQLLLFKPQVAILDEIDSGLDAAGIEKISEILATIRKQYPHMRLLIITHNMYLLEQIKPDAVHIMAAGSCVATGGQELVTSLVARGYHEFLI